MSKPLLFTDAERDAAPTAQPPLHRGLIYVLLIFAATRLLATTGAYLGSTILLSNRADWPIPISDYRAWSRGQKPELDSKEARYWAEFLLADFSPLTRFDGNHYRSIIESGYDYREPAPDAPQHEKEQNIAFFPLFPLLCWPLAQIMSANAAMVLVAHAAALAAGLALYRWVRWRCDHAVALGSVALAYCWPSACYYSFAYAESLTLLLLVLALWQVDRRNWLPAAVFCGLATATRPTALAIAVVFALAYLAAHTGPLYRRALRLIPLGVVSISGIAAYALYLTVRFGSPFVYTANFRTGWVPDKDRADWIAFLTFTPVFERFKYFRDVVLEFPVGLIHLTDPFTWNMPLNLFLLFVAIAGMTRVPRSYRPLLILPVLVFLHAYIAGGGANFGVEPIGRYMAVTASAFVVLAAWCQREWAWGVRAALFAFILATQFAWALRFGLGEWSG